MFCASGTQITGIYNVFVPAPSKKITGIYAVFTMLQDVVSICEKDKTLYSTLFLLPEQSKKSSKNGSKTAENRLPKASYNFSLFLPGPEGFWGVGGRGAPRVAKARVCKVHRTRRGIAGFVSAIPKMKTRRSA